jgi:hypothetical protein
MLSSSNIQKSNVSSTSVNHNASTKPRGLTNARGKNKSSLDLDLEYMKKSQPNNSNENWREYLVQGKKIPPRTYHSAVTYQEK